LKREIVFLYALGVSNNEISAPVKTINKEMTSLFNEEKNQSNQKVF